MLFLSVSCIMAKMKAKKQRHNIYVKRSIFSFIAANGAICSSANDFIIIMHTQVICAHLYIHFHYILLFPLSLGALNMFSLLSLIHFHHIEDPFFTHLKIAYTLCVLTWKILWERCFKWFTHQMK